MLGFVCQAKTMVDLLLQLKWLNLSFIIMRSSIKIPSAGIKIILPIFVFRKNNIQNKFCV